MKGLSNKLRTRLIGAGLGSVLSALTLAAGLSSITTPVVAGVTDLPRLNIARHGHTATTLADGKILIVGGENGSGIVSQAELFDPATASFSTVTGPTTPRTDHTATLLGGKVLVAGGWGASGALASTEIFNPADQTWTAGPTLKEPRNGHSATPLAGGQVLIAGGDAGSAEILTLSSSTLVSGQLTTPRAGHGTVRLGDGRVLLAGGDDAASEQTAELFDGSGFSAVAGAMGAARVKPDLRVLPDGKVLVSGGDGAGTLEVYNPDPSVRVPGFTALAQALNATNTADEVLSAQSRAAILYDGSGAGAIADRDDYATAETGGKVLIAGGVKGNTALDSAYLIDGSPALITTDQTDYSPGDSVLLTGTGFEQSELVNLSLYRNKDGQDVSDLLETGSVQANDLGEIDPAVVVFVPTDPDDVGASFTLTAVGNRSGYAAQTAFTDGNLFSTISFSITPSPVSPGGTLTWSASATCTDGGGPNTCLSEGYTNGGAVQDGYTIVIQQDTNAAFPSPTTRATATTTSGAASGTFAAPTSGGPYYYRARHANQDLTDTPKQGSNPNSWQPENSNTVTITLAAANTAPTVTAPDQTFSEGTSANYTANWTDTDGGSQTHTCTIDFGDGGGAQAGTISPAQPSVSGTCSLAHTYADGPNTYTITVSVSDGTASGTGTATAKVENVAPTATLSNNGPVDEGSAATVSFSGASDPSSADTAAGFHYSFACDGLDASLAATYAAAGTLTSTSCTFNDNGSYTVKGRIFDKDNGSNTYSTTVVVNNVAPTATLSNNGPVDEGSPATVSFSGASDPSSADTAAGFHYSFACDGLDTSLATTYATAGTSTSTSCTFNDNGSYTVKGRIFDKDNGSNTYSTTVVVNNVAPSNVSLDVTPTSIDENGSVTLGGSFVDPGTLDTHIVVINWGDGSANTTVNLAAGVLTFSGVTHQYLDDNPSGTTSDVYTVTVTVTDDDGGSGSGTTTVTVNNVAPTVSITSPADWSIIPISSGVTLKYQWTDPGSLDTFQCKVDWGDSTPTSPSSCTSPQTSSHTYAGAGVYLITVTVTDDDGGVGSALITVVIYDPSAGFVTGGGWIDSQPGAYLDDLALAGKANFGFVSKYLKGATVPTGNTEFVFHAGGMNFHSSVYDWLVVNQSGTNAQFKGSGSINGEDGYQFMIWATDGGKTGVDKFRIKIWETATSSLVYDNGFDQQIAGGSIVIQTGGKK